MSRLLQCLLLLLPLTAGAAPPRIVVSLPPLHSLVTAVAGSEAEVHLLLRGGASPHAWAMAPSDARALAGAELVVAADPSLEGFLERPLASLAADAEVIWLTRVEDVKTLRTRAGGTWIDHDHAHDEDDHESHEEKAHGHDIDSHAWLDPHNAIAFVRQLAQSLSRFDPANARRYRSNAERRIEALRALDRELSAALAPIRDRPYLVFHDGYQYFERRYGLSPIGAVALDPSQPPGAKRLHEIHERIEQTGAVCAFAEPQFEPRIIRVIEQATGIRTATLDPLGAQLEPGPELYEALLRKMATDLKECLQRQGS